MSQPIMPADTDGKRLWVLWATLDKLVTEATPERPLIPSSELRQFLLEKLDNNKDRRDDILHVLRSVGAIDLVNRAGNKNKKYFVTKIGVELRAIYRQELDRWRSNQ